MKIRQPVLNTLKRVGITEAFAQDLFDKTEKVIATNRFSGETCEVNPLIYYLINWVYNTSNDYENGNYAVKVSDFDRIRYFILEIDPTAYSTCID